MLAAFGVSVMAVGSAGVAAGGGARDRPDVFTWIGSADFQVPLGLRLDPLSAVMILVVTGIGFLIHLYSTAYMIDEEPREYARYFAYLNLFAAFMLLLVLGDSLIVMFVGWEGVGLCSYLLIGFWYHETDPPPMPARRRSSSTASATWRSSSACCWPSRTSARSISRS